MTNLDRKYTELMELAEQELITLVRQCLNRDKNEYVSHFSMGMGTYFFTDIDGRTIFESKVTLMAEDVVDFIDDWDDVCKLSGLGYKIYRGKVVTDW